MQYLTLTMDVLEATTIASMFNFSSFAEFFLTCGTSILVSPCLGGDKIQIILWHTRRRIINRSRVTLHNLSASFVISCEVC